MYNSISDDFLNKEHTDDELVKVREKYNLPEKFVLYLGTLQPRKNVSQLVDAFARIGDKMMDLKLVICGNRSAHNYDKRIDEEISANNIENQVIFPGYVDEQDKVAIFKLAHVFVFPSLYEGFGIPVLEAMSQKTPVLASAIPSLKEIAGNGALYFDTASLDDFSKKLYDISMDIDLRNELIRQGMERISFFSWKKAAEKTLAIFENLSHN
jgi:glycosyltransferase involved in cell wall biosynthesis